MADKELQQLQWVHGNDSVREALIDHADDIRRMQTCAAEAGYEVSEEALASAWLSYSGGFAATWLELPDDDRRLLADLLTGNDPPLAACARWTTSLIGRDDGAKHSLELPNDLLAELGWATADVVEIVRFPDGEIRLRKI